MESSPKFSIVIPVYNEERQVAQAMQRINAFLSLKNCAWECFIVSDGSTDQTTQIVKNSIEQNKYQNFKLIAFEKNQGKGAVVRAGMLAARGDYILMTDVDLSAPIKEMDKLILAIDEGADIAIGSRAVKAAGADVRQSFKRRVSGRIFNLAVQLAILKGIKDTQCGFKCFKKSVACKLFGMQKLDGFSFDVEILYLAKKMGYSIKEVAVMWSQGQESKISFLRDTFRMLRDLFRIKNFHARS